MFGDLTVNPPADMLKKAEKDNWSLLYWNDQVRANDPHYIRSEEARTYLKTFSTTMRALFPGMADKTKQAALMKTPFYKRTAMWYLKQGLGAKGTPGQERLYSHITNTRRWNQTNPYWRDYARNANPETVLEANPLMYKAHLSELKNSFKEMGMELPDSYYKAFFQSRYANKSGFSQVLENLKGIQQGAASFGWFTGAEPNKNQVKQLAFGGPQQTDLRSRLSKSLGVRNSFLGNEAKSFDTQLSQQGKLVKPLI
jgi:hypothetical protein